MILPWPVGPRHVRLYGMAIMVDSCLYGASCAATSRARSWVSGERLGQAARCYSVDRVTRSAALDAGVREHQPQPAHDRGGGHQGPPGARQPPRRGAAQLSYPGHTWGTHGRLIEMTRCVTQWVFPSVPLGTACGQATRWPWGLAARLPPPRG